MKHTAKFYNKEFYYWAKTKIRDLETTQQIVANSIGFSRQYVSALINGYWRVRKRDIIVFCYVFNCIEETEYVWKKVKEEYERAAADSGRKEPVQRQKRSASHTDMERRSRRSKAPVDNKKNYGQLYAD
jgi:plasmid maintenance system antidote protein VapI